MLPRVVLHNELFLLFSRNYSSSSSIAKKASKLKVRALNIRARKTKKSGPPGQLIAELRAQIQNDTKKKLCINSRSSEGFLEPGSSEHRYYEVGWGEDRLKPPEEAKTRRRRLKSSSSNSKSKKSQKLRTTDGKRPSHLIQYEKRIEGVLEHIEEPILQDLEPPHQQKPIATLAHGLDRVLFNPGVHWLQDPRSRVYNFTPWLEKIPKVNEFAFERIQGFIKSSSDADLRLLAQRERRPFAGSTSSLSGMLSQIYFLLSDDKPVDISTLSHHFRAEPKTFTPGQRAPAAVVMNLRNGVYAIDSYTKDPDNSDKNILTWLGTLLEKFLTASPEEFTSFLRSEKPPPQEEVEALREAYRYSKSKRFVMRSQLDCHDRRLPGTGVFDIKTRACVPIRQDLMNFEENAGYLIKSQYGIIESFEKEYYDLIRSAFLKYKQVRIGNMDGVIVAYHNTERVFGFQYVSLSEMDERLFGPGEGVGDRVFEKCIGLMEEVTYEIIQAFPGKTIRCTFETREESGKMDIWVEPEIWDGDPTDRPIAQYQVKLSSYTDGDPIRGSRAVSSSDGIWTVHYDIAKLEEPKEEMREALAGAESRKTFDYCLPSGVNVDQAKEFYNSLNFGGKVPESPRLESDRSQAFRPVSERIKWLRSVARAGREESTRLAMIDAGKPKVVWGQESEFDSTNSPEVVDDPWMKDAADHVEGEKEHQG